MKISKTRFKGLLVFESSNFYDNRGYFRELTHQKFIKEKLIFTVVSKSKKNVLRGLHMQTKFQQGKYISVVKADAYGHGILGSSDDLRDDTVQIIQKPFSLEFLIHKIEGRMLNKRVIGEQVGKLMTASQDVAAIR